MVLVTIYTFLFDAKCIFQFAYKWLSFASLRHTYVAYIITKKRVVLRFLRDQPPFPQKEKIEKILQKKRKEKKGKEKKNVTVNVGLVFLLSGKKHWSLYKEPYSVWYLIIVQS